MIQGYYLSWAAFVQHPHLNQLSPSLNKQVVLPYLYQLSLIVLGYCLSSLSPLHHITHTRASLALGLMDLFPEFEYLLLMPPMNTVGYSGTFSLAGAVGGGGMKVGGRGGFHQLEDLIIDRFLSQDARAQI